MSTIAATSRPARPNRRKRHKPSSSQQARQQDTVTGQTGGGQALLTPGANAKLGRCTACEWSPAERFVSGPERAGHGRALNKADTRRAVCSSFTAIAPRSAAHSLVQLPNSLLTDGGSLTRVVRPHRATLVSILIAPIWRQPVVFELHAQTQTDCRTPHAEKLLTVRIGNCEGFERFPCAIPTT